MSDKREKEGMSLRGEGGDFIDGVTKRSWGKGPNAPEREGSGFYFPD